MSGLLAGNPDGQKAINPYILPERKKARRPYCMNVIMIDIWAEHKQDRKKE
jgi:hypothetical protein